MTLGSFTAVTHVPSAGYRWTEPVASPNVPSIWDAIAVLRMLDQDPTDLDELAKAWGTEEQGPKRIVGNESRLPEGGPWLVENDPVADAPWGRRQAPMRNGELGQLVTRFAKLKTADDYLNFANRYGRLGHPLQFESLEYWETHTRRVRALWTIAHWIFKRDEVKLAWVVRWSTGSVGPTIWPGAAVDYAEAQDEKRHYEPIPEATQRVTRRVRNRRPEVPIDLPWFWKLGRRHLGEKDVLPNIGGRTRCAFGNVIEPARVYLFDELNRSVEGHITTKLMPFASKELLRVYVVPDCLLATIYLQLQLMVGRGVVKNDWKHCEAAGCLNFFQPQGNRRYCSSNCQVWGRSESQRRYREAPRE
jgi:hypothetical protein